MFAQRLLRLNPYVPGEQPVDREYIKLNANENPYPPSPLVDAALADFNIAAMRLYPDPDSNKLKSAITSMLNKTGGVLYSPHPHELPPFTVTPDMVFCGNGSDEVLSFIFYALFDGKKPLVIPEHTYSFYPVYAGFYDIPLKRVPLLSDFSLDSEALLAEDSCGLIFANPNAPTGLGLSLARLEEILRRYPKNRAVVVDEAYVDFGGQTALPLLNTYENLLVVRTFSKSMSFAGMRLGFAVGSTGMINALTTVKNSFNHFPVDAVCQAAGIAACSDADYYAANCRKIARTRDRFAQSLQNNGWTVLNSQTNFVFAAKNGFSGRSVYERIREAGILVRHFNISGISDFVRISIGTDEHMERLLEVMRALN